MESENLYCSIMGLFHQFVWYMVFLIYFKLEELKKFVISTVRDLKLVMDLESSRNLFPKLPNISTFLNFLDTNEMIPSNQILSRNEDPKFYVDIPVSKKNWLFYAGSLVVWARNLEFRPRKFKLCACYKSNIETMNKCGCQYPEKQLILDMFRVFDHSMEANRRLLPSIMKPKKLQELVNFVLLINGHQSCCFSINISKKQFMYALFKDKTIYSMCKVQIDNLLEYKPFSNHKWLWISVDGFNIEDNIFYCSIFTSQKKYRVVMDIDCILRNSYAAFVIDKIKEQANSYITYCKKFKNHRNSLCS